MSLISAVDYTVVWEVLEVISLWFINIIKSLEPLIEIHNHKILGIIRKYYE